MLKLTVCLCLFLLAGCAEPVPGRGPAPEAALPPERSPTVIEYEGRLTGIGADGPAPVPAFVGVFSVRQPVQVMEGASSLSVDMTWGSAAPTAVYLVVEEPHDAARHTAQASPPFTGGEVLSLRFEDPTPGTWYVSGRANGPAVEASYLIRATLD